MSKKIIECKVLRFKHYMLLDILIILYKMYTTVKKISVDKYYYNLYDTTRCSYEFAWPIFSSTRFRLRERDVTRLSRQPRLSRLIAWPCETYFAPREKIINCSVKKNAVE